ncbi:hypothetical protein J7K42_01770 [bacterium]|nr:hypothetical protein [bacterium]
MEENKKKRNAQGILEGKKIALCLTGSIAIIAAPKFARELRKKHKAEIQCFMTENAVKHGVSPEIMKSMSKKPVVTELTGSTEHLSDFDLVIVYPATFNTINKIANGIADNAVTSLCGATTPDKLFIVPTMNLKFYSNPILQDNLAKLKKLGITILEPKIEERVVKATPVEKIIDYIIKILSGDKNNLLAL